MLIREDKTVRDDKARKDKVPGEDNVARKERRPARAHTGRKGHAVSSSEQRQMAIIPRDQHNISRRDISDNALKVLYRLNKSGYEAYLVGGGVRDLLLGRKPKDFDITTSATPEQVRKLFRNCRLVGRRFRLAHVMFGPEIIEVATFRGHHEQQQAEDSDKNSSQQAQMACCCVTTSLAPSKMMLNAVISPLTASTTVFLILRCVTTPAAYVI